MKAAKETLIVCWLITILSFIGLVGIHAEIDIQLQEIITNETLEYDYDERDFYQGIWSNIFTGAIVSVLTTYITYGRAKHERTFELASSEQMLALYFTSITSFSYKMGKIGSRNNHDAILRFRSTIEKMEKEYDRMIQAANDYSPFFKTKRVKVLTEGKLFLQELWIAIAGVHDDLLIYSEEPDLITAINDVRNKVNKHEPKLHEVYSKVWGKK